MGEILLASNQYDISSYKRVGYKDKEILPEVISQMSREYSHESVAKEEA